MQNKLLTLAGVLALLAVLGKFYAGPAIAQTVRAALVQDRDSLARQPFSYLQVFGLPNTANLTLPAVPAGKRRIINGLYLEMSSFTPCSAHLAVGPLGAATFSALWPAPVLPLLGPAVSVSPIQIVMNPGDSSDLQIFCNPNPSQTVVSLTGYDIDIP
jgi:hypothetical protein